MTLSATVVVTAEQMRAIEGRVFAAGMPVSALMEKVGGLLSRRIQALFPQERSPQVGVLVGPGHNGGDALVVARELHFRGYRVKIYSPFTKLKELTEAHAQYAKNLGVSFLDSVVELQGCDFLVDGLFGFGLTRNLEAPIAPAIDQINQFQKPIVSIDLPSGLQTDTGVMLGTAIRATHTLCLGLWKQGLLQDHALEFVGHAELLEFDLPSADIEAIVGTTPAVQRVTPAWVHAHLPLPRPASTHKYRMGHLLLICGSERYAGGAILTGLGARASGVGMLSIAVPASLKPLLVAQLPDALILGCPETETGAIAHLPPEVELSKFQAIACGPGLTTDAAAIVRSVLASDRPLVLDADGLNVLAQMGTIPTLACRRAMTVLTPHQGEFQRLFPDLGNGLTCRVTATRAAAEQSGAIVLLKGARITVANADGQVWINPESTPALARGGSGDVLTGLTGGFLAQHLVRGTPLPGETAVVTAAWCHAQAGIRAAHDRTELGVDAVTLGHYLATALMG
ncbi:MAG: NAD(P)H-hydrate dehydratase [Leptolyngbyaceae cyanobacterium bins.59]|nr:NAD(P)H-hydrate dehydratase [Leptolyngbyaceae cyanobacterium bins.59]